jgi:hypothetical protein
MPNRFTKVCYALAATAAVTTLGLSAAGAASASVPAHRVRPNATPSCGVSCINLYNEEYGPSLIQEVWKGFPRVGAKFVLAQASNSNPAEDFTYDVIGTVEQLCDAYPAPSSLSPTSYACLNYDSDDYYVLEADFAPLGYPTGQCAGVALTDGAVAQYTPVTLQTCGTSNAMWIADTDNFAEYCNPPLPPAGPYVPWINAADTPSSHPEVLTYGAEYYGSADRTHGSADLSNGPRYHSRDILMVAREKIFSDGTVFDSQEWGVWFGIAP